MWEFFQCIGCQDLRWIPESLSFSDCTYIIGTIHDKPEYDPLLGQSESEVGDGY